MQSLEQAKIYNICLSPQFMCNLHKMLVGKPVDLGNGRTCESQLEQTLFFSAHENTPNQEYGHHYQRPYGSYVSSFLRSVSFYSS